MIFYGDGKLFKYACRKFPNNTVYQYCDKPRFYIIFKNNLSFCTYIKYYILCPQKSITILLNCQTAETLVIKVALSYSKVGICYQMSPYNAYSAFFCAKWWNQCCYLKNGKRYGAKVSLKTVEHHLFSSKRHNLNKNAKDRIFEMSICLFVISKTVTSQKWNKRRNDFLWMKNESAS